MAILINWKDFQDTATDNIRTGKQLHEKYIKTKTQDDLTNLTSEIKEWKEQVDKYYKNSFDTEEHNLAQQFYYAKGHRFNIPRGREKDESQLIKESLEDLSEKIKIIEYHLKILDVCDAIVRPTEIDLNQRMNYQTEDILSLIMEKYYDLYDNHLYSIRTIISGNGIELKRYDEYRELGKLLENSGYLEIVAAGDDLSCRLTLEGKLRVEDSRKSIPTDYSRITNSQEELNSKIDEIKKSLEKLGLGQEIIFDELEELRTLYSKLDKKNWGHLLTGKLFDLFLKKALDQDAVNLIFKRLTDQVLKIG